MLQKTEIASGYVDHEPQPDRSHFLRPSFYWELFKRRVFYFLLPCMLVLAGGVTLALMWPATYFSSGKILVTTQQIPTELVRPTVTTLANERIQVIQQRVLTRDNLAAIVAKFDLYPSRRAVLSTTELTELVRKSIVILPTSLGTPRGGGRESVAIVFTVGFYYEDAKVATRVSNELVTRILNEDLRDRTGRAVDTTRFLTREYQRLNEEYAAVEAKLAQAKRAQPLVRGDQTPAALAQLRAEYIQKSQIYSEKHPALQTLKKQLEAFEKAGEPSSSQKENAPSGQSGLDALEAQKESLQKNLEETSAKLAAARLGETLERDQQSEKFEVIEQPTEPQEAYKPDRPKMIVMSAVLAVVAGFGLAFAREMLDHTVRRSADLARVTHTDLVIAIPYIATVSEQRRSRRNKIIMTVLAVAALTAAITAAVVFLPPVDVITAKLRVMLSR
jgi:uncharacterized protein involved in exopolysaccharide biosynthesis